MNSTRVVIHLVLVPDLLILLGQVFDLHSIRCFDDFVPVRTTIPVEHAIVVVHTSAVHINYLVADRQITDPGTIWCDHDTIRVAISAIVGTTAVIEVDSTYV
jgi:hypothetical protein